MKLVMSISILFFGSVFGYVGQLMDHGAIFGGWSILLGTIGSFAGIWVAVKLRRYF
jgi:uncharacterized membrane protein YeaQ/YmgE (transglycosylase-associated protein family)